MKRVAGIIFSHESNTFSRMPTGIDNFRASLFLVGDEIAPALRGTNSEIGGFLKAADQHCWAPVCITAAQAMPGGTVTEEARKIITDATLAGLRRNGPFDGLFVALHGAMVTQTSDDGETQFLRLIREIVGDDIPIAVTFDLHANIFDELTDYADIAVSYRTYPHIDMAARAEEACALLDSTMKGEITPALTIARPPQVAGCDDGRTTNNGPMVKVLASAAQLAKQSAILGVSINTGFPEADVFASGPNVIVCYDKARVQPGLPDQIATELANEIWGWRRVNDRPIPLTDCLAELDTLPAGKGPVVLADYADNPGSGAYSDCTTILAALLERGIENAALGAINDPVAAADLVAHNVGETVTISIGGKVDPNIGGGPIMVTGIITAISDGMFTYEGPMFAGLPGQLGPSACLRVDGVDILVTSQRVQLHDLNPFRILGVEPAEKSIIVVKSMQHFRAAFTPIARKIFVTDAGGLSTPDPSNRAYKNVRRPVYPLDHVDKAD